ncbi:MAG: DUF433 domain-containing protein [Anaerolineaceae bacterium]|nr:DUF433 domain-containing protein [Anaerolineaceae bacterium]
MELVLDKHIEKTAGVRGGKACITGTRMAVSDVVLSHFRLGESLDEIAVTYDLPLAAVYAAIAYYLDHKVEIDSEIENGRLFYEAQKAKTPSLVQQKLAAGKNE